MSDLAVGGDGWFQLWANGPVTPAAMTLVIFNLPEWSPMELIVPLEPAEIEPAVAEAAPPTRVVEVEAAPEGGDTAAEAKLEAHLSLPEAMAWFEGDRSGGRSTDRKSSRPRTHARQRDPTRQQIRRLTFIGELGVEPPTESQ
jgi:hypothetical protein